LKPLLSERITSYLNPESSLSQFGQSRSFMEGLEQANKLWKVKYKVTSRGLKRPMWIENDDALNRVCHESTR
jgi:xeroderma pigmentosum group C-complementing protein